MLLMSFLGLPRGHELPFRLRDHNADGGLSETNQRKTELYINQVLIALGSFGQNSDPQEVLMETHSL